MFLCIAFICLALRKACIGTRWGDALRIAHFAMFMLRSTVIVAIASVLFVYIFPWTLSFGRATTASVQPFTSNIPGWHHPRAYASEGGPGGSRKRKWHIHDYLGGNGPWINRADANSEDIKAPSGCEIVQVHMLSRHNERYPTMKAGLRLLRLLERLYNVNITISGDLNFLYDWTFFSSDPQKDFDQLTSSGPFAGTLGAFTTGVKIRTRYGHLLEEHTRTNRTLNLWAGDSLRVIETAQHFAAGLLGLDWRSQATLHVVPEDFSTGGNTLTPGKACPKYQQDLEHGREGGYAALARFTDATFGDTAGRLQKFIRTAHGHDVQLTTVDVYAMQELCGFEIMTRGVSPWCDVFTPEEWERFAYARDLLHFYRAGPGGKYSHAMGHIYLNATSNLMLQGPDAGSMFFSL